MKYLTYAEEMKLKYPDRPYITRPTWELKNMALALTFGAILNTSEENQRMSEVTAELNIRRVQSKKAVA